MSQYELHHFNISTTVADSQSLNKSFLEILIPSTKELVIIRDLSDIDFQLTCGTLWASIYVGSKCLTDSDNFRFVPLRGFYVHIRLQETASPGIICIGCDQCLRYWSEHGTSPIGIHSLTKVQIEMLNESTESEVSELASSTVEDTVLAILQRQSGRGITIVSL